MPVLCHTLTYHSMWYLCCVVPLVATLYVSGAQTWGRWCTRSVCVWRPAPGHRLLYWPPPSPPPPRCPSLYLSTSWMITYYENHYVVQISFLLTRYSLYLSYYTKQWIQVLQRKITRSHCSFEMNFFGYRHIKCLILLVIGNIFTRGIDTLFFHLN